MLRRLSVLALFLVLLDISRSSEVQQSVQMNEDVLVNKKLLPNIKHLLKDGSDGNRQKFLHLIDELQVDGYKFVDGKKSGEVQKYSSHDSSSITLNWC
jgi:hypothetical protein